MQRNGYVLMLAGTLLSVLSMGSQLGCGGKGSKSIPPPTQTQAPIVTSQPNDLTVGTGMEATFSVSAKGEPRPSFQWFTGTPETGREIPGAQAPSYTLPSATAADHGQTFFVKVTNALATVVSSVATLTVAEKPMILRQAFNVASVLDAEATFSVEAVGAPTLSFQWERSEDEGATWVQIPGATTPNYTFMLGARDLGVRFRAIVSNDHGFSTTHPVRRMASVLHTRFPNGLTGYARVNASSMTVTAGVKMAFSLPPGETTKTCQWQRLDQPGGAWTDIQGAIQPEYEYTVKPADKDIQLRVLANDGQCTTISNPSKLISASQG